MSVPGIAQKIVQAILYAGKSSGGRMTAQGLFFLNGKQFSLLGNCPNHKEKDSLWKYELGSVTWLISWCREYLLKTLAAEIKILKEHFIFQFKNEYALISPACKKSQNIAQIQK